MKKYIVKKGFQFRYAGFLILIMVIIGGVILITFYINIYEDLLDAGIDTKIIRSLINKVNQQLFGRIVLLIILISGLSFFLSHRVAGPIDRLIISFKNLGQRNLSQEIKVRKIDELKELVESFNQALKNLRADVEKNKQISIKVEKLLNELDEGMKLEPGFRKDLSDKLRELKKLAKEAKEIQNKYKI